MREGVTEFVYASPAPGFAQVALAYTSQLLNVKCTVFCELLDGDFHEFSLLAESYGATIHACDSLGSAEERARTFGHEDDHRRKLPLGFGSTDYTAHLRQAFTQQWAHVIEDLGTAPKGLWLPVGSATLATTFRETLPDSVVMHCVDVRVLEEDDPRITRLRDMPGVVMYRSDQRFLDPATTPPPIPSNAYYDAKLWPLIEEHATHGDLWWNVAR
ncbi:MAG: PLP-dependent lyase/thiolase [Actinomycetota bacterium]|nr:PLP-dependent lyase/thiolase [Actinomycetota bacterium]